MGLQGLTHEALLLIKTLNCLPLFHNGPMEVPYWHVVQRTRSGLNSMTASPVFVDVCLPFFNT